MSWCCWTRPSELLKDEEYELTVSAQVFQVSMTQQQPVWLVVCCEAEGREAAVDPVTVTETAQKNSSEIHGREHVEKYRIINLL